MEARPTRRRANGGRRPRPSARHVGSTPPNRPTARERLGSAKSEGHVDRRRLRPLREVPRANLRLDASGEVRIAVGISRRRDAVDDARARNDDRRVDVHFARCARRSRQQSPVPAFANLRSRFLHDALDRRALRRFFRSTARSCTGADEIPGGNAQQRDDTETSKARRSRGGRSRRFGSCRRSGHDFFAPSRRVPHCSARSPCFRSYGSGGR
jgi:hypothetical protein